MSKKTSKRKLKVGDHIIANRGFYNHHGIYVGKGDVVHFTGSPFNMRDAMVKRTSLEEFRKTRFLGEVQICEVTIKQEKNPKFTRNKIVERAISRIGERGYNLVFNNCETFCNWCINNSNKSQQVNTFFDAVLKILN